MHKDDMKRFIDLFSKFTKIPKKEVKEYLLSNDIQNLMNRPQSFTSDLSKLEKIKELNELRFMIQKDNVKEKITGPKDVFDHLFEYANKKNKEYLISLFLDTSNHIIHTDVINIGSLDSSIVDTKDILKKAILYDAKSVILSHNHPSGNPSASQADINVTKKVYTALSLVDVKLLDHIILGDNYYSIRENGGFDEMIDYRDIIRNYTEEFPAVKYLSDKSIDKLENINKLNGKVVTVENLKQLHTKMGKDIENGAKVSNDFKELDELITDFRKASLKEQTHEGLKLSIKKDLEKSNVIDAIQELI